MLRETRFDNEWITYGETSKKNFSQTQSALFWLDPREWALSSSLYAYTYAYTYARKKISWLLHWVSRDKTKAKKVATIIIVDGCQQSHGRRPPL